MIRSSTFFINCHTLCTLCYLNLGTSNSITLFFLRIYPLHKNGSYLFSPLNTCLRNLIGHFLYEGRWYFAIKVIMKCFTINFRKSYGSLLLLNFRWKSSCITFTISLFLIKFWLSIIKNWIKKWKVLNFYWIKLTTKISIKIYCVRNCHFITKFD